MHFASIVSVVVPAPEAVPVTIVGIIMVMPVRMVPVVIVPVVGSPGTPVCRIVAPVPGRPPYPVSGMEDMPDQWPCSNIIIACMDHIGISTVGHPCVSRVRRVRIDGLHNVIRSVERFISD